MLLETNNNKKIQQQCNLSQTLSMYYKKEKKKYTYKIL